MTENKLVIGSRGSPLALWQANWTKAEIESRHPELEVEIKTITTSGDKILDVPLAKVGGKGLFVKEIEEALLRKEIDIAVHSMKDVPMKLPRELNMSAITERENPFDALVSSRNLKFAELPQGARIGTSSLRRSSQLLSKRPDLQIVPLRGNLNTRLRKLEEEGLDAIILAAAGLRRMGWEDRITEILTPDIILPAMGQGALGIETRVYDVEVISYVTDLDHEDTHLAVEAERTFVGVLEGGCQVPIGAYAMIHERQLTLKGLVASLDGKTIYQLEKSGPATDAKKIGVQMGNEIMRMGADKILREIFGKG